MLSMDEMTAAQKYDLKIDVPGFVIFEAAKLLAENINIGRYEITDYDEENDRPVKVTDEQVADALFAVLKRGADIEIGELLSYPMDMFCHANGLLSDSKYTDYFEDLLGVKIYPVTALVHDLTAPSGSGRQAIDLDLSFNPGRRGSVLSNLDAEDQARSLIAAQIPNWVTARIVSRNRTADDKPYFSVQPKETL